MDALALLSKGIQDSASSTGQGIQWDQFLEPVSRVLGAELFTVQGTVVTLKNVAIGILVLFAAVILSKVLRRVLDKRVYSRFKIDVGLKYAFQQFTHYLIVAAGLYVSLSVMGFPLGIFVGMFALLSVGIGFGMQNIASNFISGLILLLERPIKIGDRIAVGSLSGDVAKISLRTTVLQTMDEVGVIVPNSMLLENEVTNWSYGSRRVRIHVPIGVAYGSDIELVTRTLLMLAGEHAEVLKDPQPAVMFREFADSSLNFDLVCWIPDIVREPRIQDALNRSIDAAFREHGIEIPFPQRDVHLPAKALSAD